jgi:hypothetical protein
MTRSPGYGVAAVVLLAPLSLAIVAAACGAGDARPGVTVEPLASRTAAVPIGGKPAAPAATATPAPADTPTEAPDVSAQSAATQAPAPDTPAPSGSPAAGRWIDVDVTNFVVRLMDGASVVQEIGPVGVGAQIDTGEYLSTQTGLFYVHNKVEGLVYDAPYGTYISHWVGFDPAKDNGFHSFLKDAGGAVVDASTGRVSNGCIRTGSPEAIYAFAEAGMPVWVHW